ncbi:MAG: hypothetical protein M5U14_12430 [Acidimicrobiia bacterium]|nr:hypothetical protein [Acidimicrobiia bacterium]
MDVLVDVPLGAPLPGGSLHGRPRPPLENVGDDYEAVLRSLLWNLRWLFENPDGALLDELYAPETADAESQRRDFALLEERGLRWADDGYRLLGVDVKCVLPNAVTLVVTDEQRDERLVDAEGEVLTIVPRGEPETSVVLLVRDELGRWRIASWVPLTSS